MDQKPPQPAKRYLRVPEAAEYLGFSQKTIWKWIYSRRLESCKIGRGVRIPVSALEELAERGRIPAA